MNWLCVIFHQVFPPHPTSTQFLDNIGWHWLRKSKHKNITKQWLNMNSQLENNFIMSFLLLSLLTALSRSASLPIKWLDSLFFDKQNRINLLLYKSLPMVTSPFISLSTHTTAPAAILTLHRQEKRRYTRTHI